MPCFVSPWINQLAQHTVCCCHLRRKFCGHAGKHTGRLSVNRYRWINIWMAILG
ncbi:DUF2684 family protein [Cronobacter turicensis]|nr:DUF2684 family protein [Cronobacter turicensis]EGT5741863.1 DUF2684 family protein [Cronobacter turicensis]